MTLAAATRSGGGEVVEATLGGAAAYVAGYLALSASLGPGPQRPLQLLGLAASLAALGLALAGLVLGLLWASTFGSVFARWVAVPLATVVGCTVFALILMKAFQDVAGGPLGRRAVAVALGLGALAGMLWLCLTALERWRVVDT